MELNKAREIANELVEILRPYSEIINIAGSIRREKPEVKDIEIVCAPKILKQLTLFDCPQKYFNADCFISALKTIPGTKYHGQSKTGRNMRFELVQGINLDLYAVQKHDYYRQFACRTGSGDYSHKVLAYAWVRKGWVGTPDGLRKREECSKRGSTWKCYVPNPILPIVWQSEQEYFDWSEIKWIKPSERNV